MTGQRESAVLAVLALAGAAGACFVIGGACDIRNRENPAKAAAYIAAGAALVIAAAVAYAARRATAENFSPDATRAADPAAGLIGPLLAEAASITREAAA